MSSGDVSVAYEIATDDAMVNIVRRGDAVAERKFAHSVHLDVGGFEPGRSYWYRFKSGDAVSSVGRAITLPAPGAAFDKMRFGFVSCSNYEHGYFSAYRHLTDENPDVVLFLGDYIYDTIEDNKPIVRRHSDGVVSTTLPTYRNRYAQYRLDPDLQRLHARVPSLVTWDDHEVENDYADQWSQWFVEPARFLQQRAAAYQAFYEHMPVRPILSHPEGPVMRVYDRFTFGSLIEISMIDGRQYRSREACYGPPNKGGGHVETNASCPERLDPGRSMMGFAQESWLGSALAHTKAQWNVIAQDVLMAQYKEIQNGVEGFWTDDWDGYPANRTRLLKRIADTRVSNPVVIGGDVHSFFANDLKLGFRRFGIARRGDGVCRYVDLVLCTALRSAGANPAGQSARAFLRKPQARLCQRRSRPESDAGAHARCLRRPRSERGHLDAQGIRGRERQAGHRRGIGRGPIASFRRSDATLRRRPRLRQSQH